jgi:hypothetical protein
MSNQQDYSRSRTLGTVEHLGRTLKIVRWKQDNKAWRGYLTLVYEGRAMTHDFARVADPADIEQCRAFWLRCLQSLFPNTPDGRKNFDEGIECMLSRRP